MRRSQIKVGLSVGYSGIRVVAGGKQRCQWEREGAVSAVAWISLIPWTLFLVSFSYLSDEFSLGVGEYQRHEAQRAVRHLPRSAYLRLVITTVTLPGNLCPMRDWTTSENACVQEATTLVLWKGHRPHPLLSLFPLPVSSFLLLTFSPVLLV